MRWNDAGRMIFEEWDALHARFPTVQTNAFVVMPNHLHGIVVLGEGENEITPVRAEHPASNGIDVRKTALDVTPHKDIAAIITEAGVVREPYCDGLRKILEAPNG